MAWTLVLAAASARAQESSDDEARVHYQAGASYYERADYEGALREFHAAFALSHRAQLFYNISLCHQQLGQLDDAIASLERYLAEAPDIENRPAVEERLRNLETRRDAAASSPPEPQAPVVSESVNVPAIVGFVVAGVGLVAGGIFTGLTLAEDARVAGLACAPSRSCSDADVAGLNTMALVADVSWGVSLAGAIVGTIFLFVPTGSRAADTSSLRLVPRFGTTSGLSLEGTF